MFVFGYSTEEVLSFEGAVEFVSASCSICKTRGPDATLSKVSIDRRGAIIDDAIEVLLGGAPLSSSLVAMPTHACFEEGRGKRK